MIAETDTRKKRGLGRGLNALFEDEEVTGSAAQAAAGGGAPSTNSDNGPRQSLGVDQLVRGKYQQRSFIKNEDIEALAASISVHGILQPIVVRPLDNGKFEIIAGERRWRAAQKAQLHEVPVIIRKMDDRDAMEIGLIENLQREDINILDEAKGYQRLIKEFGHTQEEASAALGKSRSHVANTLRLLDLDEKFHALIYTGKLSAGQARVLITAEDPDALAAQIISGNLSVRDAEKLAADQAGRVQKKKAKAATTIHKDADTIALEKELGNALGTKVTIELKTGSSGAVRVGFESLDQLDLVVRRLSRVA